MSEDNVVRVPEGQVRVIKPENNCILRSDEFLYCNMVFLVDTKTGDAAMIHFFPAVSENKERNETALQRGIREDDIAVLEDYLSTHDSVVGISLYGTESGLAGGREDHGSTEELRRRGAKLFRHNIPSLIHGKESGFDHNYGFDAIYDSARDELKIQGFKKEGVGGSYETCLLLTNVTKRLHMLVDRQIKAGRQSL